MLRAVAWLAKRDTHACVWEKRHMTRNGPFVSFCPFWPGFGLSGLVMAFLACFTLPFGCSFAGTFSAECDLVDACQWDNAKFIVDFRGHNGHQGHKGQNFNVVFFSGTRHTLATPSHVEVARGKRTRASSQRITRNAFFIKCFIYESHTLQFFTLNQFTTQTGISRGIVVTPSSNTFLLG